MRFKKDVAACVVPPRSAVPQPGPPAGDNFLLTLRQDDIASALPTSPSPVRSRSWARDIMCGTPSPKPVLHREGLDSIAKTITPSPRPELRRQGMRPQAASRVTLPATPIDKVTLVDSHEPLNVGGNANLDSPSRCRRCSEQQFSCRACCLKWNVQKATAQAAAEPVVTSEKLDYPEEWYTG